MKITPLIAWVSAAGAACVWAGVMIFAFSIGSVAQSAVALSGSAQTASDQQLAALKMHTLAQAIAPARTELNIILQTDPLTLADLITQVGPDAGVALRVSDASPETLPVSSVTTAPSSAGVHKLTALNFVVEADGGFAGLIRAATLLETLPVPSTIRQLDLVRTEAQGSTRSPWQMDVRVQVLTTSQISS